MNTTSTPCSASRTADGSPYSATATCAPGRSGARDGSRTSRRWVAPAAARRRATRPPSLPVAPATRIRVMPDVYSTVRGKVANNTRTAIPSTAEGGGRWTAMGGRKSVRAGALASALLAASLAGSTPVQAAPRSGPHVTPLAPAAVDDPAALRRLYGPPDPGANLADDPTADARCGDPAPDPVPDGMPIEVLMPPATAFTVGAIPASSWTDPPVTDPTWRLNYQGLTWVRPLARRAAQDGQQESLKALVAQ